MTTQKPKPERVYATLTDPETRKSKHFTVYGATVEDIYQRFIKPEKKPPRQTKQSA